MSHFDASNASFLPTLIIDPHGAAAGPLAAQLTHSGFTADSADACPEAVLALRAHSARRIARNQKTRPARVIGTRAGRLRRGRLEIDLL